MLTGVVQTNNELVSANGYDFNLQDTTAGVHVFSLKANPFVHVTKGDSVLVRGYIRQAYGLIRMEPDSVVIIAGNKPLMPAIAIDSLKEIQESSTISMHPLLLQNDTVWNQTGNYIYNSITGYDSSGNAIAVRLNNGSKKDNQPAPRGTFSVKGIVTQFKQQAPFTTGYSVVVTDSLDITYNNVDINNTVYCAGDSIEVVFNKYGSFDNNNTFILQISDSSGNFNTPSYEAPIASDAKVIKVAVPQTSGSKYRIRVNSTFPQLLGGNNGTDLLVNTQPVVSISRNGDTLTANGASQYQWYFNGSAIPAPLGTRQSYTATETGNFEVVGTGISGCKSVKVLYKVESILPVKQLSVTAIAQAENVLVTFTTIDEYNMSRYEVERSSDGVVFKTLSTLSAKAAGSNKYTYADYNPIDKIVYYRIKGIDNDGTHTYSNIVTLRNTSLQRILITPNPVTDGVVKMQLQHVKAGSYKCILYNIDGRQIFTQTINHSGGNASVVLQTGHLPAGSYRIALANEHEVIATQQIIIQ